MITTSAKEGSVSRARKTDEGDTQALPFYYTDKVEQILVGMHSYPGVPVPYPASRLTKNAELMSMLQQTAAGANNIAE
eukprot:193886-Rhodomonas_salina.1